jgi:hypothetical protein
MTAAGAGVEPSASSARGNAPARHCAWRIDPHKVRGEVDGISAISKRNVWAVGGDNRGRALALHWLGAGWRRVPVATGPAWFGAADFTTARDGWAVGGGGDREPKTARARRLVSAFQSLL